MWNLTPLCPQVQASTANTVNSSAQARIMPATVVTAAATKSGDFLQTWSGIGDPCPRSTASVDSAELESNSGSRPWEQKWLLGCCIIKFCRLILDPLHQRFRMTFRTPQNPSGPSDLGSTLLPASRPQIQGYQSSSDLEYQPSDTRSGKSTNRSRQTHAETPPLPSSDTNHANGLQSPMHWQHDSDSDPVQFAPLQIQRGWCRPVTPAQHLHTTCNTNLTKTQRSTVSGGIEGFGLNHLPKPTTRWNVATSWRLQDPSRYAIPRAFLGYPKERHDLLSVHQYKVLQKQNILVLKQKIPEAEHVLNNCEKEEVELLLALNSNGHDWGDLDSELALAVARAARKTTEAKKRLADIKVAHAQVLLQQLMDEADEALSIKEEADHQILPIINAFKDCGWTIDDLTAHSFHTTHRYLNVTRPLTLAQIKSSVSKFYSSPPAFPDYSPASEASSYSSKEPDLG
ncbi:hypothetical protein BJ165DRAFT_1404296 [Panaeolus papilionaceus]|nr:hypothetical protein BJ165DRAFT_1404296 [Panaeolus papilionaceus]